MTASNENSDGPLSDEDDQLHESSANSDPWAIDEIEAGLIDVPLEFIFADHHRQRQAALMLNLIAAGDFEESGVRNLIKFLNEDFARHIADEELGFFPLLRERCLPEDKIDALIARLVDEHKDDESHGGAAITLLEKRLAGHDLDGKEKAKISAFAEHILQHLAVENAVLLPIARVRMDAASLTALAAMLRERRAVRK
jgi:hemerythrin-like domain-containing protein